MKLVLSWILDHIAVSRKEIDPQALFERLNVTTAEVDAVAHIQTDLSTLFVARIVSVSSAASTLDCPELKKSFTLPARKDSLNAQGAWVLLKKEGNDFRYATLIDVGSEKEGLMPLLALEEHEGAGAWRDKIEADDYVLTIDNAALTNRPDLWGHRGFAREIAAILGKELRPEDAFLATKTIKHFEHESHGSYAFTLAISEEKGECGSP
jgi:phenylalanyl-tRNA synthetase beta chain